MKDIRALKVTLILKLEDFSTGGILTPEDVEISAENGFGRPLYKNDGYFVFTGTPPEKIHILSEHYGEVVFSIVAETADVLRLALVPVPAPKPVYALELSPGATRFIGFGGPKAGYALAGDVTAGEWEINLQKNDLNDLTSMWHLFAGREAADVEPVFIAAGRGYGKYRLLAPVKKDFAARGCRLVPLRRIIAPKNGLLDIPVPAAASTLYVMETGATDINCIKLGES